ncbi:MAG: hypothetical protein JWO81_1656 [Alphaproteobacteria bacterium]|nr:hypothetical protein [Alphaproteobacteria bacterium]
MQDELLTIGGLMACGFLATAVMSQLLMYFVALRARPLRRALWTAGLAYWAATAAMMAFGGLPEIAYVEPLICLPGGLLVFGYWYSEFRRTWVADPKRLPKGGVLINDNWSDGLAFIGLTVALAAIRVYARHLF